MPKKSKKAKIEELIRIVAKLRSPEGCPWDKKQTHKSIRYHIVEEVYELVDAIEREDDVELVEELGDLLLHVVFHSQLAKERGAFDFSDVCRHICTKLVHRHPHVFGDSKVKTVDAVWAQWEALKNLEKQGTKHQRDSVFDGIPRHLPALMFAEKVVKKGRRAGLINDNEDSTSLSKKELAQQLFSLVKYAQSKGWSAEALLRTETKQVEKTLRKMESKLAKKKNNTTAKKRTEII